MKITAPEGNDCFRFWNKDKMIFILFETHRCAFIRRRKSLRIHISIKKIKKQNIQEEIVILTLNKTQ